MAVDGKWNIAIETPMGTRQAEIEIKVDGSTLTGTVDGDKISGDADTGTFGAFPFSGSRA